MNETRDLIIGIDFGKEYSQICYYDRKAEEPRSLPVKVGSSQFEMPTCLCLRPDRKTYCAGLEAEYFAREKGGYSRISHTLRCSFVVSLYCLLLTVN